MKYIIVDGNTKGGAILFGGWLEHAEVADMVLGKYPGMEISSAGFVDLSEAPPEKYPRKYEATVYGESRSLGLKSQKEDAAIIESSLQTTSF